MLNNHSMNILSWDNAIVILFTIFSKAVMRFSSARRSPGFLLSANLTFRETNR